LPVKMTRAERPLGRGGSVVASMARLVAVAAARRQRSVEGTRG
jgi:hypothetical protein